MTIATGTVELDFERRRRISDIKMTTLSERTGIRYKRLRRFFRESGSLTSQEVARVDGALTAIEQELEAGSKDISTPVQTSE